MVLASANLTVAAMRWWSMPLAAVRNQRVPRYAMSFDGVDDYADIPATTDLDLDYITIEALVMFKRTPLQTGQHGAIVNHGPASIIYALIGHRVNNTFQFVFKVGGLSYAVNGATQLQQLTWYHVVALYDGSAGKLYVNGVLDGSTTAVGVLDKYTEITRIGQILGTDYLDGLIALIRIYNRALTENEIRYNYYHIEDPIRPGLVLWLQADPQYVGAAWEDLSGNGHDAALNGPVLAQVIKAPVLTAASVRNLAAVR